MINPAVLQTSASKLTLVHEHVYDGSDVHGGPTDDKNAPKPVYLYFFSDSCNSVQNFVRGGVR